MFASQLILLFTLCTVAYNAAVPASCYANGQTYPAGQTFVVSGRFLYECKVEGVELKGCQADDGVGLLPFPSNITQGGFRYECFKIGVNLNYRRTVVA
ncbi:hypothetical protein PRIPAC_84849 [Pristionchus pacificus]|uniref:Abnormal cell migration protein 18-like fibronectin type I domain-containing protein n=1 Tax=Pristionchus pacificus TaxID=54126 RepID=A0A454XRQ7_PRIPA|nr:hypothetical protein PRIPAC_84849 [Pristionchus pacificus]|eukprot:PDM67216.1 hypothetical protein PRIPAC_48633 [Pristionchus pacificus]